MSELKQRLTLLINEAMCIFDYEKDMGNLTQSFEELCAEYLINNIEYLIGKGVTIPQKKKVAESDPTQLCMF
jgi:hypothetical protein